MYCTVLILANFLMVSSYELKTQNQFLNDHTNFELTNNRAEPFHIEEVSISSTDNTPFYGKEYDDFFQQNEYPIVLYDYFLGFGDTGWFGSSVAMTEQYAAVGAPGYEREEGLVHIFSSIDALSWEEITTISPPTPEGEVVNFGCSVDIKDESVLIGAYSYDVYRGRAYLYSRVEDDFWKLEHTFEAPNDRGGNFGLKVSFNGEIAVISSLGKVYIYEKNSDSTWFLSTTLSDPNRIRKSGFGLATDVYGNYIIVGARKTENDAGAVYIYEKSPTSSKWVLSSTLNAVRGISTNFGYSLSIFEETIAVGSIGLLSSLSKFEGTEKVDNIGYVYFYQLDQNSTQSNTGFSTWNLTQEIRSPLGTDSYFGYDVRLFEDGCVVSSVGFPAGNLTGTAILYRLQETFIEVQVEETINSENSTSSNNSTFITSTINSTSVPLINQGDPFFDAAISPEHVVHDYKSYYNTHWGVDSPSIDNIEKSDKLDKSSGQMSQVRDQYQRQMKNNNYVNSEQYDQKMAFAGLYKLSDYETNEENTMTENLQDYRNLQENNTVSTRRVFLNSSWVLNYTFASPAGFNNFFGSAVALNHRSLLIASDGFNDAQGAVFFGPLLVHETPAPTATPTFSPTIRDPTSQPSSAPSSQPTSRPTLDAAGQNIGSGNDLADSQGDLDLTLLAAFAAVGAVVAIILSIALVCICCAKPLAAVDNKKKKKKEEENSPFTVHGPFSKGTTGDNGQLISDGYNEVPLEFLDSNQQLYGMAFAKPGFSSTSTSSSSSGSLFTTSSSSSSSSSYSGSSMSSRYQQFHEGSHSGGSDSGRSGRWVNGVYIPNVPRSGASSGGSSRSSRYFGPKRVESTFSDIIWHGETGLDEPATVNTGKSSLVNSGKIVVVNRGNLVVVNEGNMKVAHSDEMRPRGMPKVGKSFRMPELPRRISSRMLERMDSSMFNHIDVELAPGRRKKSIVMEAKQKYAMNRLLFEAAGKEQLKRKISAENMAERRRSKVQEQMNQNRWGATYATAPNQNTAVAPGTYARPPQQTFIPPSVFVPPTYRAPQNFVHVKNDPTAPPPMSYLTHVASRNASVTGAPSVHSGSARSQSQPPVIREPPMKPEVNEPRQSVSALRNTFLQKAQDVASSAPPARRSTITGTTSSSKSYNRTQQGNSSAPVSDVPMFERFAPPRPPSSPEQNTRILPPLGRVGSRSGRGLIGSSSPGAPVMGDVYRDNTGFGVANSSNSSATGSTGSSEIPRDIRGSRVLVYGVNPYRQHPAPTPVTGNNGGQSSVTSDQVSASTQNSNRFFDQYSAVSSAGESEDDDEDDDDGISSALDTIQEERDE